MHISPLTSHFIYELLAQTDIMLRSYLYNGYEALLLYLKTPLLSVTTLYIVILGYGSLSGHIKLDQKEFMKSALTISLIYLAVTNWDFIQLNFVDLVNAIINNISDALVSATPIHVPGVSGIDGALQMALDQFEEIMLAFMHQSDWHNWGPFFEGLIVGGLGFVVIGIAVFEIILAKVMVAILMIFTPIMAMLCYFKKFQPVFDRWLGMLIGFIFLNFFVILGVAFALNIFYIWLGAHSIDQIIGMKHAAIIPAVILGIISIGIIWKASTYAMQLGAVTSGGGGAAFMGGLIGGAMGAAIPAGKLMSSGALGGAKMAGKAGAGIAKAWATEVMSNIKRGGKK